jgi:RNA-directed DNA polymerase
MPPRVTRIVRDYAQRSNVDPALTKPDTPALRITRRFSLGGILSPLLSNIALSVLDEHFAEAWEQAMNKPWQREARRRKGLANYRLTRYADDWVLMVAGDRADAEQLRQEAATVLSTMGLRLSEEKTRITHIDEGFDFLGMRIQRHKKRGAQKRHVYTYPTRAALASVKAKVKTTASYRTTNQTLAVLIRRLNPVLRGWVNYHRHGASSKTFAYLSAYTWRRVWLWLRKKHRKVNTKDLRRRYLNGWWPEQEGVVLLNPATVAITRYRYRATIATPWVGMIGANAQLSA